MKLCLNMIVRNESARILRCLESVAPWVDSYVIVDTGSTDNTKEIIKKFFDDRRIPGVVADAPFENWSQARNAALTEARQWTGTWDYLLLVDADMVMIVEDRSFKEKLSEVCYDVIQRSEGLSYSNRRLLSRQSTKLYLGVTHEYLDEKAGFEPFPGIWFQDHADGANRNGKAQRDIDLLLDGIKAEPDNCRYYFYLGQSYRELKEWSKAIEFYSKRMTMSGWDEERWYAHYCLAICHRESGNSASFISEMIDTYNERPHRGEALWMLAKFYRESGKNFAALMAAEEGLRLPYPKDKLFVNDYCYETGLKEEFAITAFYDASRRVRGFRYCNELSLALSAGPGAREQARKNLFYYIQPLKHHCPSFETRELKIDLPPYYKAANPSVVNIGGDIVTTVRGVNYTITPEGAYIVTENGGYTTEENAINTRNFLVSLDHDLKVKHSGEILKPVDFPAPVRTSITGFEDTRLFAWKGELWSNSTVCEMSPERWCEMVLARINIADSPNEGFGEIHYADWRKIEPQPKQHEKNWMAQVVGGDDLRFHYRLGHIIDIDGKTIRHEVSAKYDLRNVSGGSTLLPFRNGWIAIVHEARLMLDNSNRRYYQHRFVWFDSDSRLQRISGPFIFHDKNIEYAAGLAWHPDCKRLMISYSRRDSSAWIATVDADEIKGMLWNG